MAGIEENGASSNGAAPDGQEREPGVDHGELREPREQRLAAQRRALPDQPGVYLFRDAKGRVIYVGKAKSIKKRVASHFSNPSTQAGRDLLPMIDRIEALVVTTEAEALLAEQNFIKQYKPRFNIRLRDDKSYPYIGISLDEDFPRVYFTRERHRRDRVYFGPYSNAKRVRETLDLLGKVFMFRTCEGPTPGRRSGSPCLDYYIKRCEAPCVGYVSKEDYRHAIDGVIDFLSGRYRAIEAAIENGMKQAAAEQRFEDAARERNRLRAIRHLLERQRVANEAIGTLDAVAIAVDGREANAQVFQVRDGVLSDRQGFYLENEAGNDLAAVAEAFLLQYYGSAMTIPPLLVVQREVGGLVAVAEALAARRGSPVELRAAERGDKRRILELAERNARLALDQERLRTERRHQQRVEAMERLQEALGLDALPLRIECFDISNLGGTHTVASMVVFEGGAPKKADYRRFTLREGVEGVPDDFASMEEVLTRRLAQFERQHERSPHDEHYDASFAALPNLVVIDGGKGQLSAGLRALEGFRRRGVAVVSLAKRIEEIFTPGSSAPIVLPHDTPELQLLQRVRDEAHRFAIGHHRVRRDKAMTVSILDNLAGVGPARKRALLKHFGSPEAFLAASREELEAVPGLPGKVARDLYAQINKTGH
jgi:excinuclease ABC subunit C